LENSIYGTIWDRIECTLCSVLVWWWLRGSRNMLPRR